MSRAEAGSPLAVLGGLHLEAPSGRCLRLRGKNDRLELEAQSFSDLRGLAPRRFRAGYRMLTSVARRLRALDLILDISVAGLRVMQLGALSRSGRLPHALSLPSARISPRRLIAAALRSRTRRQAEA